MTEYDKKQENENKNQLAIDFDGVIHKNSRGYYDGTVYDIPMEGTKKALKLLSKQYILIIFTCKAKPDRPLINGKTGTELVWEWLGKYKLDIYIKDVVCEKPRAAYYIDDKGIEFESWDKTIIKVK